MELGFGRTGEGPPPADPLRDQFNLHKPCLGVINRHNPEEDDFATPEGKIPSQKVQQFSLMWDCDVCFFVLLWLAWFKDFDSFLKSLFYVPWYLILMHLFLQ